MTDFELKLKLLENQEKMIKILEDIRWICAYTGRESLPEKQLEILGIPLGKVNNIKIPKRK